MLFSSVAYLGSNCAIKPAELFLLVLYRTFWITTASMVVEIFMINAERMIGTAVLTRILKVSFWVRASMESTSISCVGTKRCFA